MPGLPSNQVFKGSCDPLVFPGPSEAGKTSEKYAKHQKIFSQGEIADTVFFVQKGKVKITAMSEHGKEAVIGISGAGQFFGEACLHGVELRTVTSQAMEECLVTSITRTTMLKNLRGKPEFSEFFLAYLLSRNSRIEDALIDQFFNSSERRLARLLLRLADFGEDGDGVPTPVTLSQGTLAEMIGANRSRVSFFMNKFRKQGYISYNGKIDVHRSLLEAVSRDKTEIGEDEEG